MSIESVMLSNRLILCHPLLPLPSIFPSIRVFSNESALCIRQTKYWSFSFNTSPSNEHSGLISFRMDWLDLLAAQGTQESSPTPQFKSTNSSVLSFLYVGGCEQTHLLYKRLSFQRLLQFLKGHRPISCGYCGDAVCQKESWNEFQKM